MVAPNHNHVHNHSYIKIIFRGFAKSVIQWNELRKEWNLTLYQNKEIYGFCNETEGEYPFGTYNWYFVNDTCTRDKPLKDGTFKFTISFSPCTPEEYTCRLDNKAVIWRHSKISPTNM